MTDAVREAVAGRELDAMVAERVMGWRLSNYEAEAAAASDADYADAAINDGWEWEGRATRREAWQWRPSTDIADAWEVVEKMAADQPEWPHHGHYVCLHNSTGLGKWECRVGSFAEAHADTAPLAICRAALAALSHEQPHPEPEATT